jgi:AraC-like DNA-binding protein
MSDTQDNPLSHLGFKLFAPSAKLAPYIQSYWFIQSEQQSINTSEYLHPDGGMSLTFNYCDSLKFDDGVDVGDTLFDGAHTSTRAMHLKGKFDVVGIRFLPAGARAFLSMPLNELKSELLPSSDIPLSGHEELYQKLADASSYKEKTSLIEAWLYNIIKPEPSGTNVVNAAIDFINSCHGDVSIAAVANRLDLNQRRLERLFNNQVGLTAKEFSRNKRIKQARFYLKQHPELSLAEVAYDLGFYDQAHFSNQFKKVVGISPKVYSTKSQINSS